MQMTKRLVWSPTQSGQHQCQWWPSSWWQSHRLKDSTLCWFYRQHHMILKIQRSMSLMKVMFLVSRQGRAVQSNSFFFVLCVGLYDAETEVRHLRATSMHNYDSTVTEVWHKWFAKQLTMPSDYSVLHVGWCPETCDLLNITAMRLSINV